MENVDTGILLHKQDIELHRGWFEEMVHLIGINVIYRSPKEGTKDYGSISVLVQSYAYITHLV